MSKRVNLSSPQTCVLCGEELPAGMTAYELRGDEGEGYRHYGKCKGVQRSQNDFFDAVNALVKDVEEKAKRTGTTQSATISTNGWVPTPDGKGRFRIKGLTVTIEPKKKKVPA